jgi:hypothetical protein
MTRFTRAHRFLVIVGTHANRTHHGAARWGARVAYVAAIGLALVALGACGSSKPAYCSARTNLENSIKGLTSLNASSGISGLQAQFKKIQTDANTLLSQAKSDFPSQTSAIKSSVDALGSAVKSLPANPSASQIATLAGSASSVVSSVKGFVDASSSKCS